MLSAFLLKFRRITSSSEFIPQIDGLRFIAISSVFFFHLQGKLLKNLQFTDEPNSYLFQKLLLNGDFGVQLFFVISGFILAMPFAKYYLGFSKSKVPLSKYFLRRVTRLEPPYFLIVIGCFLLYVIVDSTITFKEQLPHVLSALFYTHNFVYKEFLTVNLVTWSLEIEVQFYILAPLLAKVFMLKNTPRRIVIITSIIALILVNYYYPWHIKSLYSYLHFFLMGFLLVDLYINEIKLNIPKFLSIIIGVASLFLIFYFDREMGIQVQLMHFVLIIIFYFLALQDDFWKKAFSNIWLTTIGGMCYTIYLIHFPVQGMLMKNFLSFNISQYYIPNFIFQAVIVSVSILIVSGMFFRLVERPCMRKDWLQKLWKSLQGKLRKTITQLNN